ncbi:MAG: flagellar hook capping protein [Lachnospiraceae bacterium]|nr:flagellar hook capping protein [Lachnospiraceae bacterium]
MSAVAEVKDGKLVDPVTSLKPKSDVPGGELGKDAFLQLLVAQMKYQDPLQPTSNTEYISQLATFSELEAMQNMGGTLELQRASTLVGQYVYMTVTDSNGNTTHPEGSVEFVLYENSKAFLSIDGKLYKLDDLDSVADGKYVSALKKAEGFVSAMNNLPAVGNLMQSDMEELANMIAVYETMTDYERDFLSESTLDLYEEYLAKFEQIAVEPVRNFLEALGNLPKPEEMTEDHKPAVSNAISIYNYLTEFQKSLIDDTDLAVYQAIEARYKEMTGADGESGEGA